MSTSDALSEGLGGDTFDEFVPLSIFLRFSGLSAGWELLGRECLWTCVAGYFSMGILSLGIGCGFLTGGLCLILA